MAKLDDKARYDVFGDGRVILYRTKVRGALNPVWQAEIRTPSSTGRVRKSTKQKDLDTAISFAKDEFYKAEARVQQGQPLNPVRFQFIAGEYLLWLERQLKEQRISLNKCETHKRIIEKSLSPYFKSTYLHKISTDEIEKYHSQRVRLGATHQGKKVAGATLDRDNSILKAIFSYAIRRGYAKQTPQMPTNAKHFQRASFTRAEMKKLQKKLDEWVSMVSPLDGGHIRDYRELFRLYVMIITYSGIRPGKEMSSLHWSQVSYKKAGKQEFVKLSVITSKNKKGNQIRRGVVAMPQLKPYLEHVKTLPQLYNKNDYIFIHPPTTQLRKEYIGKPIATFKKQWNEFISWAQLKTEAKPPFRNRSLYSNRHYYFEMRMLNGDVPLHALAKNGGTSIQVIEKWYAEITAEQYADSLAGLIEREN